MNLNTLLITSICISGSRTTPFFPTLPLPASNCGFIKHTACPSCFNNFANTGRTSFNEINDTSMLAKSSLSPISFVQHIEY